MESGGMDDFTPIAEDATAPTGWDRAAFWAAVGVVLVFSQFWVLLRTGPEVVEAIDPAVSASLRNYYFPPYLVTLVLALTAPRATAMTLLRSPALSLLTGLTLVSVLWSIDPGVTQRRSVAVLVTTLAGVVIAARFRWPTFLEVFATAFAVTVVMSAAFGLALPRYGRMIVEFPGAWRGVWDHKNALGFNMSIGSSVFAAAALANPKRRWLWLLMMGGALALIILSQSKTSLLSFVIGVACLVLVGVAGRGAVGKVTATFLGVTALSGLLFVVAVDPDLLLSALGKDATLTGRTKIWAAVMHQIQKQPLTGYGYGAVWDDTTGWGPFAWISKEQGFVIHEAHNSWLGVWLEMGYIGLALWALLFVGVWARTIHAVYKGPWAYFALSFMAIFTLHTLTEAVVLVQNDWIWLMFAALAAKLALSTQPVLALLWRRPASAPGWRYAQGGLS